MSVRAVLITPEIQSRAEYVREFALAHPYPEHSPPSIEERRVCFEIPCVSVRGTSIARVVFFCHYVQDNKKFRNLSVSTSDAAMINPHVFAEIAKMMGFKGDLADWLISLDQAGDRPVIYAAQCIEDN